MNIDTKDEGYNYSFASSIVSNSWRKNAFNTVYECMLDHNRIDCLSINPYEISNVYFLSLDKVLKHVLNTTIIKDNNEKIFGYLVSFPIAESISINMYSFGVISIPCLAL
jgi:hypothetical protein